MFNVDDLVYIDNGCIGSEYKVLEIDGTTYTVEPLLGSPIYQFDVNESKMTLV